MASITALAGHYPQALGHTCGPCYLTAEATTVSMTLPYSELSSQLTTQTITVVPHNITSDKENRTASYSTVFPDGVSALNDTGRNGSMLRNERVLFYHNGVALTYPTTYLDFARLFGIGAITTYGGSRMGNLLPNLRKTACAHTNHPHLLTLPSSYDSAIFMVPQSAYHPPIGLPLQALNYLASIPTVSAQLGNNDPRSCFPLPAASMTSETDGRPKIKGETTSFLPSSEARSTQPTSYLATATSLVIVTITPAAHGIPNGVLLAPEDTDKSAGSTSTSASSSTTTPVKPESHESEVSVSSSSVFSAGLQTRTSILPTIPPAQSLTDSTPAIQETSGITSDHQTPSSLAQALLYTSPSTQSTNAPARTLAESILAVPETSASITKQDTPSTLAQALLYTSPISTIASTTISPTLNVALAALAVLVSAQQTYTASVSSATGSTVESSSPPNAPDAGATMPSEVLTYVASGILRSPSPPLTTTEVASVPPPWSETVTSPSGGRTTEAQSAMHASVASSGTPSDPTSPATRMTHAVLVAASQPTDTETTLSYTITATGGREVQAASVATAHGDTQSTPTTAANAAGTTSQFSAGQASAQSTDSAPGVIPSPSTLGTTHAASASSAQTSQPTTNRANAASRSSRISQAVVLILSVAACFMTS